MSLQPACRRLVTALLGLVSVLALFAAAPALAQQRSAEVIRVPLAAGGSEQLYEQSFALVIGASAYRNRWNTLPGVPGDVREVKSALEAHGFAVTVVSDPTRDQLDAALRGFVQKHGAKLSNRLLIYFAGHGHTLTTLAGVKLGYIVPVDAPNPAVDPGGFRANAIGMDAIEGLARQIDARHALFLFDSCFSGTIFRVRSGAVPDDISDKTGKPVRQFITAGDEKKTVPDESHFRREFVSALRDGAADLNKDGYITASELGMYLEREVTNYTKRAQTPRYGKIRDPELDKGDFVFVSPVPAPAKPAPFRLTSADEVEQRLWDSIDKSTDPRDFRGYLDDYPQGRFAPLARRQIRVLESTITAQARSPSTAGTRSTAASAPEVKRPAAPASSPAAGFQVQPKLYVLAVGVGAFASKDIAPLKFPGKDARDVAAALLRQKGRLYRDVQVRVLSDAAATRDAVVDGLEWLQRQPTQYDTSVLFVSGHGVLDPAQGFTFLTTDSDLDCFKRSTVSMTDIRTTLASVAGRSVAFLDTCSGQANSTLSRGLARSSGLIDELASAESGVVVFSACSARGGSYEDALWTNGAFAKALIEGLDGKAAFTPGSDRITVKQLDLYVSERVLQLTNRRQSPVTQFPAGVPDFPLAMAVRSP
jgi:uncharacterized caspase-like protein